MFNFASQVGMELRVQIDPVSAGWHKPYIPFENRQHTAIIDLHSNYIQLQR